MRMVTAMKLQRVRKELSQIALSKKVGIPQCKISVIERGMIPEKGEARKIARALNASVNDLFPAYAQEVRG